MSQFHQILWLRINLIIEDWVVRRCGYTLSTILTHQIKVINIFWCDGMIEDSTWLRIIDLSILFKDNLCLNSFVNHNESEFAWVSNSFFLDSLLDLFNFILHYNTLLWLTYSISVEDNLLRINTIGFLEHIKDFTNKSTQISSNLIIFMLLKRGLCNIFTTSLIDRSTKS